jgi:hypothetical protein
LHDVKFDKTLCCNVIKFIEQFNTTFTFSYLYETKYFEKNLI